MNSSFVSFLLYSLTLGGILWDRSTAFSVDITSFSSHRTLALSLVPDAYKYTGLTTADRQRQEWIDRSVSYYSKVMRKEKTLTDDEEYLVLAKKHYFALRKIKDGKPDQAARIYRRIIHELSEDHQCDHAKLAVTTLLLALHLQRLGDVKATRSVFLNFFRLVVVENDPDDECACSAKVLQAFALFEMKQGHSSKSLELALKAIQLDQSLAGLLKWKQFRDVMVQRGQLL